MEALFQDAAAASERPLFAPAAQVAGSSRGRAPPEPRFPTLCKDAVAKATHRRDIRLSTHNGNNGNNDK